MTRIAILMSLLLQFCNFGDNRGSFVFALDGGNPNGFESAAAVIASSRRAMRKSSLAGFSFASWTTASDRRYFGEFSSSSSSSSRPVSVTARRQRHRQRHGNDCRRDARFARANDRRRHFGSSPCPSATLLFGAVDDGDNTMEGNNNNKRQEENISDYIKSRDAKSDKGKDDVERKQRVGVTEDGGDNSRDERTTTTTTPSMETSINDYYDPFTTKNNQKKKNNNMSAGQMMRALGTSPRRIVLSVVSASGIALAGNLFGVTSALLQNIDEDAVAQTGLDTYYPRGEYKRYNKPSEYTFVIPREWVADTSVELAKAQQRTKSLDYTMQSSRRLEDAAAAAAVIPDAAFGPPGRYGGASASSSSSFAMNPNVSVIRSSAAVAGRLSLPVVMKDPPSGASFLLDNYLAPSGSGRRASLLRTGIVETDGNGRTGNTVMYELEYRIDPVLTESDGNDETAGNNSGAGRRRRRGGLASSLRAISILAESTNDKLLYTMTVVAPEEIWTTDKQYETKLRKIASSFRLL